MKCCIFISHSSKELDVAEKLVTRLERAGATCWIAPRDIQAGESWREAITRGMEECTALMIMISENANQSDQVRKELALADARGLPIIPLRIEDVLPSGDFEYELAGRHWIDMLGREDGDLDHAARAILYASSAMDSGPSVLIPPQEAPEAKAPEDQAEKTGGSRLAANLLRGCGLAAILISLLVGLEMTQSGQGPWWALASMVAGGAVAMALFLLAYRKGPGATRADIPVVACAGGPLNGKTFAVSQSVTIGRNPANDLVLPEQTVSSHHAVFERDGDCLVLRDLRSTNGTYVNGEKVAPERRIQVNPGDVVTFSRDAETSFRLK